MTKEKIAKELYGLIADINVEEILDQIKRDNLSLWCNSWRITTKGIVRCVESDNIAVKDAVSVVRCKNCRFWNKYSDNYGKCAVLADRDREGGASFDCDTESMDYCSAGQDVL